MKEGVIDGEKENPETLKDPVRKTGLEAQGAIMAQWGLKVAYCQGGVLCFH